MNLPKETVIVYSFILSVLVTIILMQRADNKFWIEYNLEMYRHSLTLESEIRDLKARKVVEHDERRTTEIAWPFLVESGIVSPGINIGSEGIGFFATVDWDRLLRPKDTDKECLPPKYSTIITPEGDIETGINTEYTNQIVREWVNEILNSGDTTKEDKSNDVP